MATFAWRRRPTRHFGEQWTPVVDLSVWGVDGRCHTFLMQLDPGAVISVLDAPAATLLGVRLENGQAIEMSGVGGPPNRYFVHELTAQLGDLPDFRLRIAFANREDVPLPLGRLDLLERFRIDLDPRGRTTRFELPA